MAKKIAFIITVFVLVFSLTMSVGCTLAYLVATTDEVTNTFLPQNIDIELEETTGTTYLMIPGVQWAKDPKVTVDNDIDCYAFVVIDVQNNVWNNGSSDITAIEWAVASGWTLVSGTTNVYYREVAKDAAIKEFSVLNGDAVTVSAELTKAYMDAVEAGTIQKPTLTFAAYATQKQNGNSVFSAAEAWNIAKP